MFCPVFEALAGVEFARVNLVVAVHLDNDLPDDGRLILIHPQHRCPT